MNYLREDTIAAISTPQGMAGIGIVRMSGKDAITIANKIFVGKIPVDKMSSHTIQYGKIIDPKKNNELIDRVLLTLMRSPKTYTREDIVEINCHGGALLVKRILDLLLQEGATLALPGEFTARAFLNGRVDLIQAAGVKDLIEARCYQAMKIANEKLEGKTSFLLNSIKEKLFNLLVNQEALIDFPEEEIDKEEKLQSNIEDIINSLKLILKAAERGDILKSGIRCPIVGKPNVGKSTLFNALLNKPRAIVTHIPGTTRDTLEEYISLDGLGITIIDTAGIREIFDSIVEEEGIKRTQAAIKSAFLIILVLDISLPLSQEDFKLANSILNTLSSDEVIIAINKIDLKPRWNKASLKDILSELPEENIVEIAATKDLGIEELIETLKKVINKNSKGKLFFEDSIFLDAFMKNQIFQALSSLEPLLNCKLPEELVCIHLKEAYSALSTITSPFDLSCDKNNISEDLLTSIFSKFCIGK
jgi:tRNA modification GTPase